MAAAAQIKARLAWTTVTAGIVHMLLGARGCQRNGVFIQLHVPRLGTRNAPHSRVPRLNAAMGSHWTISGRFRGHRLLLRDRGWWLGLRSLLTDPAGHVASHRA
ncbi:hypothetical protein BKA63DRAFT_331 [Paraphoma chrysanthemicola]|nr:hypothetical protein BKA63DRAFT_331 [Paraphoma chrysanthemicola]